jgi:hypothetical protein
MAYLEQSTAYIPYTERLGDGWRYHVPAELTDHPLRPRYVETMNHAFETYAKWIDPMRQWFEARYPKAAGRLGRRVSVGDSRQGARHAARHAAVGNAIERRDLRHRTGLRGRDPADARPSTRRNPRRRQRDARRASQSHSRVSDPRRPARSRRHVERVLRHQPPSHRRRRGACRRRGAASRGAGRSDAHRFRSRWGSEGRRRRALRDLDAVGRGTCAPRQPG